MSVATASRMSIRTDSYESAHSETSSETNPPIYVGSPIGNKQSKPYEIPAGIALGLSSISVSISLATLVIFSVMLADSLRYQEKLQECLISPTIAAEYGADFCEKRWSADIAKKNQAAVISGIVAGTTTIFSLSTCVYAHFFWKLDLVPLPEPLSSEMQKVNDKMMSQVRIAASCNILAIAALIMTSVNINTAMGYYNEYTDCTRSLGYCDNRLSQFYVSEGIAIALGIFSLIPFFTQGVLMNCASKNRDRLNELVAQNSIRL